MHLIDSRLFASRYFRALISISREGETNPRLIRGSDISKMDIHLNAVAIDRGLSEGPSGPGPLHDTALDQMRHVVPGDDAAHVLDAGHVAVRERHGAGIAILSREDAGEAAHPATEFENAAVSAEAAIPQQVVGQTLLGRPDAYVAGVVEADQLARGEALAYSTYLHVVRSVVQPGRVFAPGGLAVSWCVYQRRALEQTEAGESSHRHLLVGLAADRLRRACQRPGENAPSTLSASALLGDAIVVRLDRG